MPLKINAGLGQGKKWLIRGAESTQYGPKCGVYYSVAPQNLQYSDFSRQLTASLILEGRVQLSSLYPAMDSPTSPPPSPVSPMSGTTLQAATSKTRSSGKPKSYISCRTSTGIPRNSFITISSQSITVFADVKDLPSRSGSQHSGAGKIDVAPRVDTSELKLGRQSYASIGSISSFGFDVAVPEPVYSNGNQSFGDNQITQKVATRQDFASQGSFRSVWRSKTMKKNQHGLYESFPRPPSKGLLNFATVFSVFSEDKQPVYVDKSLPPPPYHVFGATKKKGIMYLMALVCLLTPLSTFIYFPVLGDISRVSAPSRCQF